jgi:hypothetical protein
MEASEASDFYGREDGEADVRRMNDRAKAPAPARTDSPARLDDADARLGKV